MLQVLLFLALTGGATTSAQTLRPSKVNICYPIGNNVHATKMVAYTELDQYPGYIKGNCGVHCQTLCLDFPSFNATANQYRCNGAAFQCGSNAKVASTKQGCICKTGYKGNNPVKGCTDFNECASNKTVCPASQVCRNTVGSFSCVTCGANSIVVKNQCKCKAGFEGDAIIGCTDIDECANSNTCAMLNQKCENTAGAFQCVACGINEHIVDNVCECQAGFVVGYFSGHCDRIEDCVARTFTEWIDVDWGCRCLYGYQGDPMVGCSDINECEGDWTWCQHLGRLFRNPSGYTCLDTGGGYLCATCGPNEEVVSNRCQCQPGYAVDADGTCQCIPGAKECDACGPGTSMDSWGETCICKDGYEGDPTSAAGCIDIDECALGLYNNHCFAGVTAITGAVTEVEYQCRNVVGAYACDPCGKNAQVVNGRCICLDGFSGDPMLKCL
jgi:Calcium-binding EGF domain